VVWQGADCPKAWQTGDASSPKAWQLRQLGAADAADRALDVHMPPDPLVRASSLHLKPTLDVQQVRRAVLCHL